VKRQKFKIKELYHQMFSFDMEVKALKEYKLNRNSSKRMTGRIQVMFSTVKFCYL